MSDDTTKMTANKIMAALTAAVDAAAREVETYKADTDSCHKVIAALSAACDANGVVFHGYVSKGNVRSTGPAESSMAIVHDLIFAAGEVADMAGVPFFGLYRKDKIPGHDLLSIHAAIPDDGPTAMKFMADISEDADYFVHIMNLLRQHPYEQPAPPDASTAN